MAQAEIQAAVRSSGENSEENEAALDFWVREANRLFRDDMTVRMPRTEAARRDGLAGWLAEQQGKLKANLQKSYPRAADVFDTRIWPEVKPEVQRYAMFGFAAAWIGRHMGDATTIGIPKLDSQQWHVPIGVKGYRDDLGQIVLNPEGEVIPELTTTRNELLEAIREPSFSALSTAAR